MARKLYPRVLLIWGSVQKYAKVKYNRFNKWGRVLQCSNCGASLRVAGLVVSAKPNYVSLGEYLIGVIILAFIVLVLVWVF